MARHKDTIWNLDDKPGYEGAQLGLLMDIRDELKALNRTLGCYRVVQMCDDVRRIDRRLAKHMPLSRLAKEKRK